MADESYDRDAELRRAARKRLEARQGFYWMIVVWCVVNGALTAIWFATNSGGYFWPMWPMIGIGIATLFAGAAAFVPGLSDTSESAVDREVERMRRKQGL